ncbi:uncharacterized protein KY384_003707 [Bacidia gigantensis]|uniref:uncharacterized protein n=1 Tax=Bacidia gigantensis TaxID=2732470 RepID=UPI001D03D36D|nr:uncharacterized protein KY384_003707 [Bacidia gigantensis]KAG8532070.1 hypothetical protein KY384_003707 [Bacidia gigantensis]
MNVSGPAVASAWRQFIRDLDVDEQKLARLVVVHDDLENSLGKIRVKKGGSARGHNGLKSCVGSLGGLEFWRLGVGIGRPTSRASGDVASYVLRKMTSQEKKEVTNEVVQVAEELEKLAWKE